MVLLELLVTPPRHLKHGQSVLGIPQQGLAPKGSKNAPPADFLLNTTQVAESILASLLGSTKNSRVHIQYLPGCGECGRQI